MVVMNDQVDRGGRVDQVDRGGRVDDVDRVE